MEIYAIATIAMCCGFVAGVAATTHLAGRLSGEIAKRLIDAAREGGKL